jgi:hypothetical protein
MPKRGSCGSVLPCCRLSKHARRSFHQPPVTAPAEMPTALSSVPRMTSPRARVALTIESGADIQSLWRPLLSRCPTSRDFVPWCFLDAGQLSARVFRYCRRPKTTTVCDIRSEKDRQSRRPFQLDGAVRFSAQKSRRAGEMDFPPACRFVSLQSARNTVKCQRHVSNLRAPATPPSLHAENFSTLRIPK